MVQQAVDSNFNEVVQASTESSFPNNDKQLPPVVTGKKTALRDLQNDNRNMVSKSLGNSPLLKEGGAVLEAIKAYGTNRPAPEIFVSTPHQQSLSSNAANGNLFYVRRKPEAELGKGSTCNSASNCCDYPQLRKFGVQNETTQQSSQIKDFKTPVAELAPIPWASLVSFSSGKPSVPSSVGKSKSILPPVDSNYRNVSATIQSLDHPQRMDVYQWEERFCQLQDVLMKLDQSNQDDYVQMLLSLSSVDLSRHAFELEKRSIQLSLVEAKEMQRVQLLDVLGKCHKNSRGP